MFAPSSECDVLRNKLVGQRLPQVRLGEIVAGEVRGVVASDVLGKGMVVIAGMPGAFTPVCSERHLPSILRNADRLRAAGVDEIVCIATSNPFALEAWSAVQDPMRKLRFLSDGNGYFARALGLTTFEHELFLGECSKRYLMTVRDGVIQAVRVEDSIFELSCASPDDFVVDAV